MTILYSRGSSTYDIHPQNRQVPSFDAFRDAILADRGQRKGEQWIAAPFSNSDATHCANYEKAILGQPHRSGDSALPRRWLGLDADGCMPEEFENLMVRLEHFKALVYTTASHTAKSPRFRVIIELDNEVDRSDLKTISAAVRNELSTSVKWDPACDRAEQLLYLPTAGSSHWKFDGKALYSWRYLPLADLLAVYEIIRCRERVAAAPPGLRNDTLNRSAYLLGRLVGAARLDGKDVENQLIAATNGWDNPNKNRNTIRAALKKGIKDPLYTAGRAGSSNVPSQDAQGLALQCQQSTLDPLSPLSSLSKSRAIIQSGDQIEPEPINWLWEGWVARGKFHLFAGAAGTGKTTTACDLGAILTRGGRWPDGTQARPGAVLMWSGEDDVKNVLVPRFMACGADMSKVHFVTGIDENGKTYPFDPSRDLPLLEDELRKRRDISVIIVDPIVSAVGGDSHKNTETRRALQPLVDMASRYDCALIGITHLSKGTQGRDANERVSGSLAFVALARLVFMSAVSEQEDGRPQRRIFVRSKSNLGPNAGGFEYCLEFPRLAGFPGVTGSKVVWGARIDGSARSLLTQMERVEAPNSARNDARTWLSDRLSTGPVLQRKLKADGAAEGHAWATLRRAKDDIRVESKKLAEGWVWRLSSGQSSQVRPSAAQGDLDAQGDQGAPVAQRSRGINAPVVLPPPEVS